MVKEEEPAFAIFLGCEQEIAEDRILDMEPDTDG